MMNEVLTRAFRWKRMIETGEFATIAELADHEGLGRFYVPRILRMSLLAPDIVEMILAGEQGAGISLVRVMEPFPGWCQTNADSSPFARPEISSGHKEAAPLGESGGSVGLVVWSGGEAAFLVGVVVD